MYLSCDTKKFRDNESTHILRNFRTSAHSGEASPLAAPLSTFNCGNSDIVLCHLPCKVRRLVREEPALQLLIGRITCSNCSSSGAWMHYAALGGRANALQMRYGFRCFGVRSLAYLDPSSGRVSGRQRPLSCRRRTSPIHRTSAGSVFIDLVSGQATALGHVRPSLYTVCSF